MRTKFAPPVAVMAALVCAGCGSAAAQWLNYPNPGIPRLPDSTPNLAAPAHAITRAGGQLMIQAPAVFPGKFALTPQSEAKFAVSAYFVNIEIEFFRDVQGNVTHLLATGLAGGAPQKAVRQ